MDNKQIEELIKVMEKSGLRRLRVRQEKGFEIELEKESISSSKAISTSEIPILSEPEKREPTAKRKTGKTIDAPLVGTFYASSSPADPPFVKIGDRVEEGTIVGIIEAMKVMNEVRAGAKGQIVEALVDNAHPVEFGTPLFRIV